MTITEKILAAHAGTKSVHPGDIITVTVDLVLANDQSGPAVIEQFEGLRNTKRVFDPRKIVLVPDHATPNKDIPNARFVKILRDFARKHEVGFFEVGRVGIEHVLLPEQGFVGPGDLIIGGDSHTCTYGALGAFATGMGAADIAAAFALGETWLKVPSTIKLVYRGQLRKWVGGKDMILHTIGRIGVDGARYQAMEFTGEVVDELGMPGRFTMANMAIEAGAKNGIFHADARAIAYFEAASYRPYTVYQSDPDASYAQVQEIDVSGIEPQVAFPYLPENSRPISKVGDIEIDQVVIGSCTNGRLEDLRVAAEVLKGRKVHPRVRTIVIPGSQRVYAQAMQEGLMQTFVDAECAVSTPTCGPCLGIHMGILAEGERCVSTTNRNFVGRMGHAKSEIYLANPAVAAASAIAGRIASPDDL